MPGSPWSRLAGASCWTVPDQSARRYPQRRPPAALLHKAAFCKVVASRCAKASLGVTHRCAPSRVHKTGLMQSVLRRGRWWRGTWASVRRCAHSGGQWPAAMHLVVCPRPPRRGLAAARHGPPRAGCPSAPHGGSLIRRDSLRWGQRRNSPSTLRPSGETGKIGLCHYRESKPSAPPPARQRVSPV